MNYRLVVIATAILIIAASVASGALLPGDHRLDAVAEPELATGETTMLTRFAAIRVGVVLGSGLLDGVNPCAFATVVFLLSYLQLRHPRRRQLWQVGLGFVVGVFATYYVLGLGLAEMPMLELAAAYNGYAGGTDIADHGLEDRSYYSFSVKYSF